VLFVDYAGEEGGGSAEIGTGFIPKNEDACLWLNMLLFRWPFIFTPPKKKSL
jgi:hypothetical protein